MRPRIRRNSALPAPFQRFFKERAAHFRTIDCKMKTTGKLLEQFLQRDGGALTSFGLFLTIAMICVGGLAIDVANAIMTRTHLQVAADSAAHAAILAREQQSEDDAKDTAVRIAQASMPAEAFGDTIRPSDIQFGRWDAATQTFTVITGSDEAVLVSTQRLEERNNGLGMFFLRFVGLWNMDVVSHSVFETYYPTCYREGMVAQDRLDIQSGNVYREGYCLHSNSHIEMNSNNVFEDGVIVSMPYKEDLVIPASGWSSNTGLADAVRSGSYAPRILNRIQHVLDGYADDTSDYYRPDYFNLPIQTTNLSVNSQLETGDWQSGEIHTATCNGNQRLRIRSNAVLQNGVIDTNCRIVIGSNAVLENILIISRSNDLRAIDGAAGVRLGANDGCSAGGGVQIVTLGGIRFTANLQMYGVQMLAMDMIDFEANGNGVYGVSMVSGSEIDSTSGMEMGFCDGSGLENRFEAEYFRMAH